MDKLDFNYLIMLIKTSPNVPLERNQIIFNVAIDDVFRWNTVCSFIDVTKMSCFAGTFYDLILM